MPTIELAGVRAIASAGVPGVGTNAIQTLTIGGTPTAGSFTLGLEGFVTAAIPWSAVNATLLASIQAALDALPCLGTNGCVATAGTLTAGIGTILLTFGANRARQVIPTMTAVSSLTGTSPTLANATTTAGVAAFGRGLGIGALVTDITNGKLYVNTGTALQPTWTVAGAQT